MARKTGAGDLRERISLERRIETNPDAPNDYGNTSADWQSQGEVRAQLRHRSGGGEAVLAARLQGRHPVVLRVRATPLTRSVATDWRVIHRGTVYAVRDVTIDPEADGAWIDILAESGVAA